MTSYETIDYTIQDGIGEIFLDRPDVLNAFNDTLVEELVAAVHDAMERDSVYVILLSGRGRAFCAGVDTDQTLGPAAERDRIYNEVRLTKVHMVSRLLYQGSTPAVAAVNGPAIGGGMAFALACDLRIMAEDAWMNDQHVNNGIPAGASGAWLLPQLIGESKAKELVYTSRDVTAEEAADLGLVVEVTEAGESVAAARELALTLRDQPALGLQHSKKLFGTPFSSIEEASVASAEYHWQCLSDPEHQEALDALRGGRDPVYDRTY